MDLTREKLLSAFPKDSAIFDMAVDRALSRIGFEASLARRMPPRPKLKPLLGWGLALLLLLAGVLGVAEGIRLGIFDFLIGAQDALPEAKDLGRKDTSALQVGGTRLQITESLFDGATLRFVMSVTCLGLDHPLRDQELWNPDSGFNKQLAKDGVIALGSFDWFTLDGVEYSMTGGSGGETVPGTGNGEALIYFELKLTSTEGVRVPEGDFTVGVPVRQYAMRDLIPGVSREEAQMFIPVTRIPVASIRDVAPKDPQPMGKGTLTITEARLSPIKAYTTLRLDFAPEVPLEECEPLISAWGDYSLVDQNGEVLTPGGLVWGWGLPQGETDDARHLFMQGEFPPASSYPDQLFLAPLSYGENGEPMGQMDMAVELLSPNGHGKEEP